MTEEFDQYSHSYAEKVGDAVSFSGLKADFFTRVKSEYLKELCAKTFPHNLQLSLLDVGCGVGVSHGDIGGAFSSITGIDPSAESIKIAQGAHPQNQYRAFDGKSIPFDSGSFDCAVTTCVMHHVPPNQWAAFVREMRRVTRKDGLVAVFEHNPRNPLTMRVVNNCEFDANAVLLEYKQTENLLRDAGVSDVKSRHILTVPAGNRFLRRIDQLLSGLRIGAQYLCWGRA